MAEREVEVLVCIGDEELLAGRLWSHRRRGVESMTFSYEPSYLSHPLAYALDPDLPLLTGAQHTPAQRTIFGAFSDSSPDRWGRRLIARAENRRAERSAGAARSFGEIDYLLGVRDDLRQGALRFRNPGERGFLATESSGVPPLVQLPKLLRAAEHLERGDEDGEDLALLLRGGSSLGGARPKAHVLGERDATAIAKFPSPTADDWDVIRWEAVALRLAREAGIEVPRSRLHEIDGKPVLVVDRFDRRGDRRLGYVSAMTMLELGDGDRASYPEIAEVITAHSPHAGRDLLELWRRMAFSVLISNFDDHLRNHGFLRTSSSGWELSPAFDLNPDPRPGGRHLQTALDFEDTEARVDLLVATAPELRVDQRAALEVLGEVSAATSRWKQVAISVGLDHEIALMKPAFEHEASAAARELVGA